MLSRSSSTFRPHWAHLLFVLDKVSISFLPCLSINKLKQINRMWYSVSGSRFVLHITGIHLSPFPENDEKREEILRSLYLNDKKSRKVSFWNKTDKHTKIVYIVLYWKVAMLIITRTHNQNFEVTPTIYLIPHEDINQTATLKHICIYVFIFLYYCYLRETFFTILWKGKLTIRFFNFILLDRNL